MAPARRSCGRAGGTGGTWRGEAGRPGQCAAHPRPVRWLRAGHGPQCGSAWAPLSHTPVGGSPACAPPLPAGRTDPRTRGHHCGGGGGGVRARASEAQGGARRQAPAAQGMPRQQAPARPAAAPDQALVEQRQQRGLGSGVSLIIRPAQQGGMAERRLIRGRRAQAARCARRSGRQGRQSDARRGPTPAHTACTGAYHPPHSPARPPTHRRRTYASRSAALNTLACSGARSGGGTDLPTCSTSGSCKASGGTHVRAAHGLGLQKGGWRPPRTMQANASAPRHPTHLIHLAGLPAPVKLSSQLPAARIGCSQGRLPAEGHRSGQRLGAGGVLRCCVRRRRRLGIRVGARVGAAPVLAALSRAVGVVDAALQPCLELCCWLGRAPPL